MLYNCINQQLDRALFKVGDIGEDFGEEDGDAPEVLPVDTYPDGLVSSYFEKEGDELMVDLGTVFLELDNSENQFSQPLTNTMTLSNCFKTKGPRRKKTISVLRGMQPFRKFCPIIYIN